MATPIEVRIEAVSLKPMATGKVPTINAIEVIKIGRKRILPAITKASVRDLPSSIKRLVKSINKIEFFPETLTNIKIPSMVKILTDSPII